MKMSSNTEASVCSFDRNLVLNVADAIFEYKKRECQKFLRCKYKMGKNEVEIEKAFALKCENKRSENITNKSKRLMSCNIWSATDFHILTFFFFITMHSCRFGVDHSVGFESI